MYIAKVLVPRCLHKTLNIKKLWICAISKTLVCGNFSLSKAPIVSFVHWSSNKGQTPACPGQHTEDLNFSRDFQLSRKALSCTTARLVTPQHSARFAHVPQLQMWSRTPAAQRRGSEWNPLHTLVPCASAPQHGHGNDKSICYTNYFRSKWECDPKWWQSRSEKKRPEDTSAVSEFWS